MFPGFDAEEKISRKSKIEVAGNSNRIKNLNFLSSTELSYVAYRLRTVIWTSYRLRRAC